jgi:hypothetical protein
MSDEEEQFTDDDEDMETPSFRWTKDRTIFLVMEYSSQLQQATANFFAAMTEQAAADHNHKVDMDTLHVEVSKEIETLPTFTEPETSDG